MTPTARHEHEARKRSPHRIFRAISSAISSFVILAVTVYVGGFVVYVAEYHRAAEPLFDKADAIVVLTGGPDRIAEAVRLLAEKKANRLLISGVNEQTDEDDLVRTVPALQAYLSCCVTIDRQAMNTHDNAVQTIAWVRQNKFQSLILVTAHAHLPRALFELKISGGDNLAISPWRVGGPLHPEEWWHDISTIRAMVVEYTKLSGSILRYFYFKISADLLGSKDAS